ncbi:unnamed protein product [Amoebophrya sp. A120]|nr:unnamed protein product [Amoebophrya sp. A120]|eukprot:GSA120T00005444001.1
MSTHRYQKTFASRLETSTTSGGGDSCSSSNSDGENDENCAFVDQHAASSPRFLEDDQLDVISQGANGYSTDQSVLSTQSSPIVRLGQGVRVWRHQSGADSGTPGPWSARRLKTGVSDGEAIIRRRHSNSRSRSRSPSLRKNGFSAFTDRVKGYAEFHRLLATRGKLPFIRPNDFTVGDALLGTNKASALETSRSISKLYDESDNSQAGHSSDDSDRSTTLNTIKSSKWSTDQLEDLRHAFRTYLPAYMVYGPWTAASIVCLTLFTFTVAFSGFWILRHPEWLGGFMGEGVLLRPEELSKQDLLKFYSDTGASDMMKQHGLASWQIHNPISVLLIRLLFTAASWFVLIWALKDTLWAITMYTMWSWTFMTIRWTLGLFLSLLVLFGDCTRSTSKVYYGLESVYEVLRFVSIMQNGTTWVVATFVLIPFFYIVLRMSDKPQLASEWLKVNFSAYNLVLHFLNFLPFATFEHVFINPRRFNAVDMWLGMLFGFVYHVFYLFVLDRNGLHFYPFLNPRTNVAYTVGVVGIILLGYVWLVLGNAIAGAALGVEDAQKGNPNVHKLVEGIKDFSTKTVATVGSKILKVS